MLMRRGVILGALLVGCATGAVVREVALPAHAQGTAPVYAYKIYYATQLMELGQRADPSLTKDHQAAVERGLDDIAKTGWRLAFVNGGEYVWESRVGP
jgi:hypothetical protein